MTETKKYRVLQGAERVEAEALCKALDAEQASVRAEGGSGPGKERQATRPTSRRGLAPDLQALVRLDRILSDMEPDQAARAIEWLVPKFGKEALAESRYEATASKVPAVGETA